MKNYKTLSYPEIDRKRGFEEIINSPIYKNYVISEDGKTSGIVVYLKKDERLAEYVKDHGGLDLIVERKYLNSTIGTLLNVLLKKTEAQAKQESNVTVDQSLQSAS